MSPRVFQLSPSKQQDSIIEYGSFQVTPPREITPSSEEMLTMPLFEHARPSPEPMDTLPGPYYGLNDGMLIIVVQGLIQDSGWGAKSMIMKFPSYYVF